MSYTKKSNEHEDKRLKVILLGSGYNALQEGNYQFIPVDFFSLQRVRHRMGVIYYSFNPKDPEKIIIDFIDENRKLIRNIWPLEGHLADAPITRPQEQMIFERIKATGELPVNPFVEQAQRHGFQIDIESIDFQKIPNDNAIIQKEWGKIERLCVHLQPISKEDHIVLNNLVEKWRHDIQRYDGIVFVNTDGDGQVDKTYWPIYFEFERSNKVFFAEWCTCCVSPRNTHKLFNHSEESRDYYKSLKADVEKNGSRALFNKSTAARTRFIDYHSLEQDLNEWLEQLSPSASLCQPCHPAVQKSSTDIKNGLKDLKQVIVSSSLIEGAAKKIDTIETTLEDLDMLLDTLFAPENHNHSELLAEMVTDCLFKLDEPILGAYIIMNRISLHIDGATNPLYKDTLISIRDNAEDMLRGKPQLK